MATLFTRRFWVRSAAAFVWLQLGVAVHTQACEERHLKLCRDLRDKVIPYGPITALEELVRQRQRAAYFRQFSLPHRVVDYLRAHNGE